MIQVSGPKSFDRRADIQLAKSSARAATYRANRRAGALPIAVCVRLGCADNPEITVLPQNSAAA